LGSGPDERLPQALERIAPGKVRVELGCGHGVLACLAAHAGARRVYAIEAPSMIEIAREVVRINRMEDRVVFVEANSLDVELDEPADVVYADLTRPDPLDAWMLIYTHDAGAAERRLRRAENRSASLETADHVSSEATSS
jgi:ribosomal protein L11 methylase PrmA